ncbi:putative cytochrome P450 [Nemania sp. FL0031]|nr:putative cytochrome P450 [Nemania sp. FL0031]
MLAFLIVNACLAYVTWTIACLEANVRKAEALKVPTVSLPIDSNNVIWILLQPHVWEILDRLPIKWSSYPRFVRFSLHERARIYEEVGPMWALVSLMAINIHFADPDAIRDILKRRGDFQRPYAELEILELYGPCISTASWEDWHRHRGVMATPFNEMIMKSVWDESLRQAKEMVHSWTAASTNGIASYQKDTRTLSLSVLAATGFGKAYNFRGSTEPQISEVGDYRDSLQLVLDNIILLMLIPAPVLSMLPESWARIGRARVSFQKHMVKVLEEAHSQDRRDSGGIMASFVPTHGLQKRGFSTDEILGNLFVINFAGHDTTDNTLAFGMLLLAANPEVQAWLAEEITLVTGGKPLETLDYKELYPRLKRCRATMYEVLRLSPPHNGLTQTSGIPSRWISNPAPATSAKADQLAGEQLVVPSKRILFPFAELEAVAVLAGLLETHRLTIKKLAGESDAAAIKRAHDCSNDVDLVMLIRLRDADRVTLVCSEV